MNMTLANRTELMFEVYRSAFRGAYSVLQGRTCEGVDAEDIATDIQLEFLGFWEQCKPTRREPLEFIEIRIPRSWAYCAGKWKAIAALRKEKTAQEHRATAIGAAQEQSDVGDIDGEAANRATLIQQSVFGLCFQDAFYLFFRDCVNFTIRETTEFWAEVSGRRVSTRTVSQHLRKARKRVREVLKHEME